jgi:hypothetical protein
MVAPFERGLIFEIQEVTGGTGPAASIGLNADLATIADANTTTGYSTVELSSTHATGTATFRIVGISNRPDNVAGEHVIYEVTINESAWADAIAGI